MPVRTFPTRGQLVAGFSVLVAVFVAALAVGLGQLLRGSVRDAALSGAEQTGRVFAELEVGQEEYRNGRLTDLARKELDRAVEASSTLRAARVWGRGGELVYSTSGGAAGRPSPQPGVLRSALAGEVQSLSSGRAGRRLLEIHVPIRLAGDRRPRNVVELHLPYGPVEAEIQQGTRDLALLLGLAALLFYGALLPSVLRASRALAEHHRARHVALQRRIRRAMRDGELWLAYQPKRDLCSGEIEGVEALLRWRLPDGREVPPGDFLPRLEPTAVMEELTGHVFDLAARQAASWCREGLELDMAVNVSACNLREEDLADRLVAGAAAHGLRPQAFTLELTESAVSGAADRDLATLSALRARGFRLSVDDFGTGESSLSRVHVGDFQELKIDRSFVRRLDEDGDPVLVACIVHLARALGVRVVAEGVESEAVERRLDDLGCDAVQGHHLARPLPAGALAAWVRHSRAVPGGALTVA